MSLQHIIEDGYTEDFYIAAEPGLWDELEGKFRPMLLKHRDEVDASMLGGKPLVGAEKIVKAVSLHVKEWSARDAKGNPAPIKADIVERLRPGVLDRLYAIISGRRKSDPRPGGAEAEQQSDIDPNSLDALEADAKN